MDLEITMPEELKTFLKARSVSLLIKGEPGTGKTILALSIPQVLRTPSFYVTTRVKAQTLIDDYPWIKNMVPENRIIDASKTVFPPPSLEESVKKNFSFIEYSDKPTFLRELYQMLEGRRNPLIIFDSIEAVQEATSERIYYDLLDMQKEMGLSMIFVSEYSDEKKLDYLVDGIILLRKENSKGKFLRELQLLKLRGTLCRKPSYLFTLVNGVFRHFEPFKLETPKKKRRFKPLPDTETHFSTGSRDLDQILGGGYKKGSTVLVEIGKNVVREAYFYILIPTALNFLLKGKQMNIIPSLGTSKEMILPLFSNFEIEKEELERVHIAEKRWTHEKLYKSETEILKDFHDLHGKSIQKTKPEGGFISIGLDSLMAKYGHRVIEILEAGIFDTQKKKLLAVWNIKHGTASIDEIANMANYHLKIEERCGVILFQSLKPRSGTHTMEVDFSKGYPQLKLIPIT
ncbi:MAG: gas vesicle protein GvpD P-loop domain-containing protein [Candidatus Freyrarchaeum guaymaensis]